MIIAGFYVPMPIVYALAILLIVAVGYLIYRLEYDFTKGDWS